MSNVLQTTTRRRLPAWKLIAGGFVGGFFFGDILHVVGWFL